MPSSQCLSHTSRRHFLKSALSAAVLGPLAACEHLGLDKEAEPLFDGPAIAEGDFISFNAGYYGIGVDTASQLPYSFIRDGIAARESDPVSIAFRLQHLLADSRHAGAVDTLMSHLLAAQTDEPPPNNFRNMIPRLAVGPDGISPADKDYSFGDNALLASRVAMAAQAHAGTAAGDKALEFLDKQKFYFNQVLAQSPSGFLPEFANASLFGVDPTGLNMLFCGFYDAIAFVLGYFIGDTPVIDDSQVGLNTWQAMIDAQNTYTDRHSATTRAQTSIPASLARNGSGYQYFHSLLALDPSWLDESLENALYNALYSYLDAAVYDRIPGIYSAGPHESGYYVDNGLNRLAAKQRYQTSREAIVTADALASALRLFPEESDARLILRGWIGLYATVAGVITPQGYLSGIRKEGEPVTAIYARQNGAMILFKSNGARLLDAFMQAKGKPPMRDLIGMVKLLHDGAPIERVTAQLPIPIQPERLFTRL